MIGCVFVCYQGHELGEEQGVVFGSGGADIGGSQTGQGEGKWTSGNIHFLCPLLKEKKSSFGF